MTPDAIAANLAAPISSKGLAMAGSIEELKMKLSGLIDRRTELAYQLRGPHDYDYLEEIATIQKAITAIEAVIASGASEPDTSNESLIRTFC